MPLLRMPLLALFLALLTPVICEKTGAEVPPSTHAEFRDILSQCDYVDGTHPPVQNLNGFTRWSFKSLHHRGELYLVLVAGNDIPISILREKSGRRFLGSRATVVRAQSKRDTSFDVLTVRIPKQHPKVGEFLFSYLEKRPSKGKTLPGKNFVALMWSRQLKGKRDFVFARFWRDVADPDGAELVPLGPRPESATSYSIQVEKDEVLIYVNSHLALRKKFPGAHKTRFVRNAGVALNETPRKGVTAMAFFKSIAFAVDWNPNRGPGGR